MEIWFESKYKKKKLKFFLLFKEKNIEKINLIIVIKYYIL